jgi:hypothetical protein
MRLADYGGRLVCRRIEKRNQPAEDQALPADVKRVDISEIRPARDLNAPKRTYRFMWGDDIADLEIANGQRVSEAKIVVADHWNSMTELITLYCRGRKLRDRAILSLMHIPRDDRIVVSIRDAGLVYLRSHPDVGCQMRSAACDSGRAEPPANYEDLIDALVAVTGEDRMTCMRCLKYFGYDFDRALSELHSHQS